MIENAYFALGVAGFTAYEECKVHLLDYPLVLIREAHSVHGMFIPVV
jgi:hypothetical protein